MPSVLSLIHSFSIEFCSHSAVNPTQDEHFHSFSFTVSCVPHSCLMTMKRPTDQAKLLFFYLLRSSAAALATTEHKALESGHIWLRLARRSDVPSIQRCNLATLPENYNSQFYISHLRQWPELALVAEHVLPGRSLSIPVTEPNIVAYVLGKVEERPIQRPLSVLPPNCSHLDPEDLYDLDKAMETPQLGEPLGHVTSLAVMRDFRRKGLAAALMDQLHVHLEECYKVKGVGLHVRKSNLAACQLYERDGYLIDQTIEKYYQDGEDAYFMRKKWEHSVPTTDHILWRFRKERPWERQDEKVRLPRMLPQRQELPPPQHVSVQDDMEIMSGAV